MTESVTPPSPTHAPRRPDDPQSALFAGLVLQQTQMALMFLGQIPHPEKGEPIKDLEGARLFIDTLEMLQARTRGNLKPDEETMLKQSLMSVQMAFVEASRETGSSPTATPAASQSTPPAANKPEAPTTESAAKGSSATGPAAGDDETRKKFVKKY